MTMVFTWNERERKLELLTNQLCQFANQNDNRTNKDVTHKPSLLRSLAPFITGGTVSLPFMAEAIRTTPVWNQATVSVWADSATTAATVSTPISDALWPIIRMLQDFALPVGVGVATYGIIEYMLDNPAGKKRISAALFGYGGVFLIPLMFRAIQKALGSVMM